MTRRLDVQSRHREQIERLLREHLPAVEVWAYGSRVNGQSHAGSDLDLVLRSPGLIEIDSSQLAEFNEAVQESTIPFLIEARDWARLPESFQREIEREYVVLVAADEWTRYTVDELKASAPNALATGPFGSAISSRHFIEHGIPVIRGSNLSQDVGTRLNDDGLVFVSEEKTREFPRSLAKPGDLVFTCWGTIDQVGLIDDRSLFQEYVVSNKQMKLTPDTRKANSLFLYYLFSSPSVRNEILNQGIGSSVPGFNLGQLRSMKLTLPPLPEQRAIAHILGTLDDKIELNRRMNETLEEMARALFKSWFIDFDPVHAKAALKRPSPPLITPPLRGSRQAKGDSPQARRWGVVRRSYTQHAQQKARSLRENRTDAEGLLWHYLRHKQLDGHKFRRQQPIGPYIVDFACMPRKVIVELDGGQHAERRSHDERRDRFLQGQGYRLLRFWNNEVFENCFGVLERIYEAVQNPPPPQPAPGGLASATPPQGGSDRTGKKAWTVERARAYLDRMDPSIAALFPDCFVDSELGEVPAGWGVEQFGNHISAMRGLSYKGAGLCEDNEGLPMHNLNSIFEGGSYKHDGIKYYKGEYREKHLLKPGDLIVTNTEQGFDRLLIGYAAIVPESFGPVGLYSHHIYRIDTKPKSFLTPHYLVHLFNSPFYHHWISGFSNGTTINMLPVDAFEIPLVVVPPSELIRAFTILAQDIHAQFQSNLGQSRTLAALRNTLLPKLVSGEVRIPEAEKLETSL